MSGEWEGEGNSFEMFFLKIGIFLFNLGMIFSDCEVMKSGWWLCLVCIDALAVYCVVVVFDPAQEQ